MAQIKNKILKSIELKEVVLSKDAEGNWLITGEELEDSINLLQVLEAFDGGMIDLKIADTTEICNADDVVKHL